MRGSGAAAFGKLAAAQTHFYDGAGPAAAAGGAAAGFPFRGFDVRLTVHATGVSVRAPWAVDVALAPRSGGLTIRNGLSL